MTTSSDLSVNRTSVEDIRSRKGGVPLVCLTAYTTPVAQRLDAYCDLLLVGDSVAMVVYGMDTTVGITLDTMINHGKAVMRGSKQACVVIDLPAGSYEGSVELALASARRVIDETGAQAVKLEGGVDMALQIRAIVDSGIPVVGHVGLQPQKVEEYGGFVIQGKGDTAQQMIDDAVAVADAGAFALVIEGTVEPVARAMSAAVDVPTIGIGASVACDGQILVTDDMIGLFRDFTPKFVQRFGEVGDAIEDAARDYRQNVLNRTFPGPSHVFQPPAKST